MSGQFNGTNQSLTCSTAALNSATGHLVGWFLADTIITEMYIAGCGQASSSTAQAIASLRGDASPKAVRGTFSDGSTAAGFSTTTGIAAAGVWHWFDVEFNGTASRAVRLDNAGVTTNTTSVANALAYNRTTIAKTGITTTAKFFGGQIGHVGWYSAVLSSGDRAKLAAGANCLDVSRSTLVHLWDLWDINDLTDKVGGLVFTTVNSPTTGASQPPVDFGHRGALEVSYFSAPPPVWPFSPRSIPSSEDVILVSSAPYVPSAEFQVAARLPDALAVRATGLYQGSAALALNGDANLSPALVVAQRPPPRLVTALRAQYDPVALTDVLALQEVAQRPPRAEVPAQRSVVDLVLTVDATNNLGWGRADSGVSVAGDVGGKVPVAGAAPTAVAVLGVVGGLGSITGDDTDGRFTGSGDTGVDATLGGVTGKAPVVGAAPTGVTAPGQVFVNQPVAGSAPTNVDATVDHLQAIVSGDIAGDASTGVAVIGIVEGVLGGPVSGDASTGVDANAAQVALVTNARVGQYRALVQAVDYRVLVQAASYTLRLEEPVTLAIGSSVRPTWTIVNEDGQPDDPTAQTLTIVSPSGVNTVYGSGSITKLATGRYRLSVRHVCDESEVWVMRVHGTGGCEGASPDASFYVAPSAVVDPTL